jgi:hypothetical protein
MDKVELDKIACYASEDADIAFRLAIWWNASSTPCRRCEALR